ncbi:MAG: hypothetical protein FWG13_05700 [Leptospirales bacterium]|nr:hypothetical protein [Leptospirales bacterium]
MEEHIPEDNLFVLFLLIVLTCGLYYFWWLARTSRFFGDDPTANILITFFTLAGGAAVFYFTAKPFLSAAVGLVWMLYLNIHYFHKSELLHNRDTLWCMALLLFVLPLAPLMIQNNINEKRFQEPPRRF